MSLGQKFEFALFHFFDGLRSHALGGHPPLRHKARFNNVARSRADRNTHSVGLLSTEEAEFLQLFLNEVACIISHDAFERSSTHTVDCPIVVQNRDFLKVVLASALEIIWVVSRSDLYSGGTKVHIHKFIIKDNRNTALPKRVVDALAMQVLVPWVLGMDCDTGVAQHRLQTCGSYHNLILGGLPGIVNDLVCERSQVTKLIGLLGVVSFHRHLNGLANLLVVNLDIRECCVQGVRPVHQTGVTVNEPVLEHADERFCNTLGQSLIHGEDCSRVVHRCPETAELVQNVSSLLIFPRPNFV
mmetsp:Transcript_16509/g.30239  ORF Transcript_16509/g.30239 Transcript_16509/m.30239 type:complete len:300 (+) Transcript_16509:2859-3758(+)